MKIWNDRLVIVQGNKQGREEGAKETLRKSYLIPEPVISKVINLTS